MLDKQLLLFCNESTKVQNARRRNSNAHLSLLLSVAQTVYKMYSKSSCTYRRIKCTFDAPIVASLNLLSVHNYRSFNVYRESCNCQKLQDNLNSQHKQCSLYRIDNCAIWMRAHLYGHMPRVFIWYTEYRSCYRN